MVFTQEDYIKIQQWLSRNSIKDTEFNEANIPFNGEEIVTIVQGNQNKKVFLRDLVSQIFELGVSDFINITEKYNAPNISLEEAIRLIPSRARKEGQVITQDIAEKYLVEDIAKFEKEKTTFRCASPLSHVRICSSIV